MSTEASAPRHPDVDEPDDACEPDDDAPRASVARHTTADRTAQQVSLAGFVGVASLRGRFDGAGTTRLAHYSYGLNAFGGGLRARGFHPVAEQTVLGIDAKFAELHSQPGIAYVAEDGQGEQIPVTLRAATAGLWAGYRAPDLLVAGRIGWDFVFFGVGNLANLARLPSERRHAGTVGVRLDHDAFLGSFALRAAADAIVLGSVVQTVGHEDGPVSRTMGARLSLSLGRPLGPVEVSVDYDFALYRTNFEGPSARVPGSSTSERTELLHTFFVAVALVR